jgi:hypothetical protein
MLGKDVPLVAPLHHDGHDRIRRSRCAWSSIGDAGHAASSAEHSRADKTIEEAVDGARRLKLRQRD